MKSKNNNIQNAFRQNIISQIYKEYQRGDNVVEVFLCDVDREEEYKAHKTVLKELVAQKYIKKYSLFGTKRDYFIKLTPPAPPSALERELDPLVDLAYRAGIDKHSEAEAIYGGDYPCHAAKIKREDIDIKQIHKLIKSREAEIVKSERGKIEIIEMNKDVHGQLNVYINQDYGNPLHPRRKKEDNGSYWQELYLIARNGECAFNKNLQKYFNINLENPIYKRLSYNKTAVLAKNRDKLLPKITVQTVTQETINRRLGQKRKNKNKIFQKNS